MLKAVIIEDDSFAREMLTDLLDHHTNEFAVVGFFDSVKSALKSLPSLKPDLVFLDMELTDGKGFDILEQLPEVGFEVIVTTMYDSYMLKAIEHSALDYLFKPITAENLASALERFENKLSDSKNNGRMAEVAKINKIILPTSEGLLFLNIGDIIRLESEGAYTTFHTQEGKKHMTSRSMLTYEDQLLRHGFFRVHHSHLINIHHISKYVKGEGGYVIMTDNAHVDVSRRKKDEFMKLLGY